MRKIATLLLCLFYAATASAQTYTNMQWGINRGVTPYAFGAYINNAWRDLGTVSAAGAWSIPSSNLGFTPIGTGAVATTIQEKLRQTVSVIDFGATPDNNSDDDAPAFRNAIKSNRNVNVPPGVYTFKTLQAAPCCAAGPPAVRVTEQSNFKVSGPGAVINMDSATNSTGVAPAAFIFDKDTNFEVEGLYLNGNKTGLTASQENAGFLLFSIVDAHFHDLHFGTGWGGIGAPIVGDWFVNVKFDHIIMDAAGICADVAYLKNVSFSDIIATGADFGQTGAAGNKCFSNIIDLPNAANNFTGVSFTSSNNVSYINNTVTNFAVGAAVASGTDFYFHNNYWIGNPGIAPGAKGIGVYVYYLTDPVFSSVGFPPQNITIDGDTFKNNGSTVAGAGVFIDSSTITNSDQIKNINILNSRFINNNSAAITTTTTSHMDYGTIWGNTYEFTGPDANTVALARPITFPPTDGDLRANSGGNAADAGGGISFGIGQLPKYSAMAQIKGLLANAPPSELQGGIAFFTRPTGAAGQALTERLRIAADGSATFANSLTVSGISTFSNIATFNSTIKLKSYTVATLPTCNAGAEGSTAYVTDATSPTYNATLTGGGAVRVPVFCNGANWTAH